MSQAPDTHEIALPTFAVLARFCQEAADGTGAVRAVVARLTAAEEPFHEVEVERQEGEGSWMVVARFVIVSVDGHTALTGLVETLAAAGLTPDEVWLDRQVS
jgi:hypothetical protein